MTSVKRENWPREAARWMLGSLRISYKTRGAILLKYCGLRSLSRVISQSMQQRRHIGYSPTSLEAKRLLHRKVLRDGLEEGFRLEVRFRDAQVHALPTDNRLSINNSSRLGGEHQRRDGRIKSCIVGQ